MLTSTASGIFLFVDEVRTRVTGCLKMDGVLRQGASVNPSKPFLAANDAPDFVLRLRFGPASENLVRPIIV